MKRFLLAAMAATTSLVAAQPALAAITWTDWTSSDGSGAVGSAGAVGVTYTGPYAFVNTAPSTDYYTGTAFPAAYKPSNTDIVALNSGGRKVITFSQAVNDVYLAVVSWNIPSPGVSFSDSFTTVTPLSACGFWGCGTLPASGTSFPGAGEVHGVIKFAGPITSLVFEDTSENWHGFTVGFGEVANGAVPEPATWAMMIAGFGLVGAALRRRRQVRTTVSYA